MSATRYRNSPLASSTVGVSLTREECLQAIEKMRERVNGYVAFIGRINNLQGSSTEAKEKAVADFLARMTTLERQLGRICEELELG
jgi:hypothetical protein